MKKLLEVKEELYSEFCQQNNYKKGDYLFAATTEARKEFDNFLYLSANNSTYQTHPQNIYTTSCLLDFKNLPELQNSKEINEQFYEISKSVKFNMSDLIKSLEEKKEQLISDNKN